MDLRKSNNVDEWKKKRTGQKINYMKNYMDLRLSAILKARERAEAAQYAL